MGAERLGLERPEVALAAAAVVGGVAVEALAPAPATGHADAVCRARHRREVAGHQRQLVAPAPAQERDHAHVGVVAVDPAEAGDRKSTRLNSSHLVISYAVFCLKKKKKQEWSCTLT